MLEMDARAKADGRLKILGQTTFMVVRRIKDEMDTSKRKVTRL